MIYLYKIYIVNDSMKNTQILSKPHPTSQQKAEFYISKPVLQWRSLLRVTQRFAKYKITQT